MADLGSPPSQGSDLPPSAQDKPAGNRSFGFLRKTASREAVPNGGKRSMSQKRLVRRNWSQRENNMRPDSPGSDEAPRLPSYQALPSISDPYAADADHALHSHKPYSPQTPQKMTSNGTKNSFDQPSFDPYARSPSMTNRGRQSYASSALEGPRRPRRRKDPTPFNILIVGAKGSGKTSFVRFLHTALAKGKGTPRDLPGTSPFESQYIETDIDGERIGVTLYDSSGLERHLADLQLREITSFVESKFQETFNEEQKVMRDPGVKDPHIHCVLLIMEPSRIDKNIKIDSRVGCLDEAIDVEIIRTLKGKTTVIPVIAKADTVTTAHMALLKREVWASLQTMNFDPLEALELDDDDSEEESVKGDQLPDLPMSIISPDIYDPGVVGRRFPWGFADPNNPEHCDFVRLYESVFGEWRGDLREASREKWYEGWRTTRLKTRGVPPTERASVLRPKPPPVFRTNQRSVSGAAAYGTIASRPSDLAARPRVVSTSEIGLAISEETQVGGRT